MILTEIKIKHLKVRISEFEDLIFDKNILPIFTTPSILKEVEARKLSKYKIETLNPEKKLTFKVVSFNEIVEELASKINKIAIDLEPYYYSDPSDYDSLPFKVKEVLDKYKLIEEKKEIEDAAFRIKISTIKKRKLILYAQAYATKIKKLKKTRKYLYTGNKIKIFARYINKKKITKSSIKPIFNIENSFKYRYLNFEYINLFNINKKINNLILFSGLIPTSKGALMLLEDKGWDLDLLSNRNNASQRIRKLRPFKLRMLRRLRRLRRLRLINTNLFLHRSKNIERIIKDQENQGRNLPTLNWAYLPTMERNNTNKVNSIKSPLRRSTQSLSSIIRFRINEKRKGIKNFNESKLSIATQTFLDTVEANLAYSVNKNYFFKHTDNKLKFIINWIGNNLENYKGNPVLSHKGDRLDFKNIDDIFLIQQDQPVQIPLIDDMVFNPSDTSVTQELLIDNKQTKLNQISLFKENKVKGTAKAEIRRSQWILKKKYNFKKRKKIFKKAHQGFIFFNNRRKVSSLLSSNSISKFNSLNSTITLNNLSRAVSTSNNKNSINNLLFNKNQSRRSTTDLNIIPFDKLSTDILKLHFKSLKYKVKIWQKKKSLSKNLFHNTSLRYIKTYLNKNNLFSDELVGTKNFYKEKILVENRLSKILYFIYLKKFRSSNETRAWKKIASLLKSTSESPSGSKAILFWTIIKLYSSSFNSILSINKQLFSIAEILGQSSTQIKFVVPQNSNDPLSSISSTAKDLTTIGPSDKDIFNTYNHKNKKFINAQVLSHKINKLKFKGVVPQNLYAANNLVSSNYVNFNSLETKLFDPLNKKIKIKLLQPVLRLDEKKTLTKNTETKIKNSLVARKNNTINNINKNTNNNLNSDLLSKLLGGNKDRFTKEFYLKVNKGYRHNFLNIRQADNKRFLFLYFILPIFFATLRNSTTVPVLQKNFIFQINQLRSLIKLMLVSGSPLHKIKGRRYSSLFSSSSSSFTLAKKTAQWNGNFVKYNSITSLLAYKSTYQNLFNVNKMINKKRKDYKKKGSFFNGLNLKKIFDNNLNSAKLWTQVQPSADLLKWAILFIAQSLAPLKRKDNFHSLIFFKSLEAKGLLNLDDIIKDSYKKDNTNLTFISNSVKNSFQISEFFNPGNISEYYNRIITTENVSEPIEKQDKTNFTLIKSNSVEFNNSATIDKSEVKALNLKNEVAELIKKKNALITYYPGGRQISDWKNISRAIWQEEYKFNLYYKREKISLNLANKSANKKISLFFSIITIFKLWDTLKITLIKSITSFKIQALFFNKPLSKTVYNLTNFIDKIKYYIIDFIFNNINKFKKIKSINFKHLSKKPQRIQMINFINKKNIRKKTLTYKLLNNSNYGIEVKKNIIKDHISLLNYSYVLENLNKYFIFQHNYSPSYLNLKLTLLINHIKKHLPFVFSKKFKLIKNINLNFLSKNICLEESCTRLDLTLLNDLLTGFILPKNKSNFYNKVNIFSINKIKAISSNIKQQNAVPNQFLHDLEIKNSFNNLVKAKSTIIGKIRSIKLLELIDQLKEKIVIAEKLAALVRVADITDLNFSNKKKSRKINSFKYLNKKNIFKSNRIKILQTIKSIKTDFRFEQKLDSNSLSNLPISLLYYSNLKPLHKFKDKLDYISPVSVIKGSSFNNNNNLEPVLSAYLRELSIYNRETKGIINFYSKIVGYNFNYNTNKISSSIYELLAAAFISMRCLISKPVFVITPKKISIHLFYFLMVANKKTLKIIKKKLRFKRRNRKRNHFLDRINKTYNRKRLRVARKFNLYSLNDIFPKRLNLLCWSLNKIFNKPVELNLTRLHYPSADSNILVNLMGIIINKISLPKIFKKLFAGSIIKSLIKFKTRKYNDISIIPAFLTGLSIKVAGRVMTQNIRPRKTINFRRRGATASGKINYLNFARLTNKNKRGSYSITISAGQNYFK